MESLRGPIDLREDTVRRVFAQELVTRMQSIGSATLSELEALPLMVFKVPATRDELRQLTEIARRLAWLEAPAHCDGEWRLSDAGRALRRPPSIAIVQVVSRVLSIANPVRTQAKDWLPLLALVAGAVAGGVAGGSLSDLSTADAVRLLSIAVLTGSILWQFYGEFQIVRAMGRWKPSRPLPGCNPAVALYGAPRLISAIVLDVATVTAFGLLVFHEFTLAAVAAVVMIIAGVVHLIWWTLPAWAMVAYYRGRPLQHPLLLRVTKRWFDPDTAASAPVGGDQPRSRAPRRAETAEPTHLNGS